MTEPSRVLCTANLIRDKPVGGHSGRTKKVGATSNKRLRDEDDSEDGDNSKEQNQQLSKRPRTDDETGAHHQQPFLTVYRYNGVQNDEHH
ncbi:hypothetical protein FGRA07_00521 [Fusarium graminearum]|nr:hypothetical protein FGRA07_00521 [Fusarium graminearum]